MAEDDNNPPEGGRNMLRAELEFAVVEARTGIEAVAMGLESVASRPEAAPIRTELKVLEKLAGQAAGLLDAVRSTVAGPGAL